ncbi:MAG TPA: TIGR03435 family protein [Bryobacteraceae bacterium]|nr:TIGR03435 family protein [Bryobacteraceae bacterium]
MGAFTGWGQPVEFPAASVKLADSSVPPRPASGGPGTSAPGRYSVRSTLIDLIATAYGVPGDQISGGPSWLHSTLYEVDATMPPDTTKQQFQMMLQSLLAERFHLSIHDEPQDFPAFDLVLLPRGPKFREATEAASTGTANPAAPPATDRDGFPVLPPGPHTGRIVRNGNLRFKFQERSMAYLAENLGYLISHSVASASGKKPRVNDKTGLLGQYNFTLEFACADCVAASPSAGSPAPADHGDGPTIFEALERQLGLKLVRVRDVPLDVIVIDRVDRIPSPN